MAIKLPPNWCKVTLNFAVYVIICPKYFLSLSMDFAITNSADPDKMTHRVAFHLGLPCSIKYPIRGFWYTKGIQRLNISYILGAQGLSGRVLDSRPRDRGFEPHRRHCVVVLEQDTFILA